MSCEVEFHSKTFLFCEPASERRIFLGALKTRGGLRAKIYNFHFERSAVLRAVERLLRPF